MQSQTNMTIESLKVQFYQNKSGSNLEAKALIDESVDVDTFIAKNQNRNKICSQISRLAYNSKEKIIFIGDYDGKLTSFDFNEHNNTVSYRTSRTLLYNTMINEIIFIQEEGYDDWLLIRSDKTILKVNINLTNVNIYENSNELSTCNGLYVTSYSSGDEEKVYDDDAVPHNNIERNRKRLQLILTSKSKGIVSIKKMNYIGMIELFIMEHALKHIYEMPHGVVVEFLMYFTEGLDISAYN